MSSARCFAVVPAAGMGKRMGASVNKQYLLLDGVPIVARTLQVLQASAAITGILLVTPEAEIPYCQTEVVKAYHLNKVIRIVPGGTERQHSVRNGLMALDNYAEPDDIVLIHDGVRPFITDTLLQQTINVAMNGQGALTAVRAKDTIKVVSGNLVCSTPDRNTLWQAQTPQTFRFADILEVHQQAAQENFLGTDDSSLFERYNKPVCVVPGTYRNIKITTPEDLVLAEAFLRDSAGGQP